MTLRPPLAVAPRVSRLKERLFTELQLTQCLYTALHFMVTARVQFSFTQALVARTALHKFQFTQVLTCMALHKFQFTQVLVSRTTLHTFQFKQAMVARTALHKFQFTQALEAHMALHKFQFTQAQFTLQLLHFMMDHHLPMDTRVARMDMLRQAALGASRIACSSTST